MHFFYVLLYGVPWYLASIMIKGTHKYEKTLNRTFNKWSKDDIFKNSYINNLNKYKNSNIIDILKIDSTDVINANCNKEYLNRSLKLNKQAVKVSIITDNNDVPINYSLCKPNIHDSKEGFKLVNNTSFNKNKSKIYLVGDKGYQLKENNKITLKKTKGIVWLTPKKKYKKNPNSKIKIIRHSRQMKEALNKRIKIEHFNSQFHRSFKRLSKIYDKSLNTFGSFIDLAFSVILVKFMNN